MNSLYSIGSHLSFTRLIFSTLHQKYSASMSIEYPQISNVLLSILASIFSGFRMSFERGVRGFISAMTRASLLEK